MKQAHHIGIDFGTSKTLVSHINPQTKRPETLRLGRGCDYLPTSVYIDTTGQLFFGDEADDMLEDYTGRYLRGFKMQLGSPAPLHVYLDNGRPRMLTAKDLVQKYLQFIRCRVQELVYHGEPVTAATITRPVGFSPAQCEELKQAAHDAGFGTVEFSTEPEAAGLAFCRLNAAQAFKHSALIVDWGGGTLDFALVTRKGDTICTHSSLTDGDATMGGEKFDEKLWLHVEQEMPHKLNPITQLPKIRRAKELLSSRENITLRLSYEGGTCPPLLIQREDFNELISAEVHKAVAKVQKLLTRIPAEHKPEMLLLVGGSSQIPLIKEQLEATCNLPAHRWHYSREAVAMGAALWGTRLQNAPGEDTLSMLTRVAIIGEFLQGNAPLLNSPLKGYIAQNAYTKCTLDNVESYLLTGSDCVLLDTLTHRPASEDADSMQQGTEHADAFLLLIDEKTLSPGMIDYVQRIIVSPSGYRRPLIPIIHSRNNYSTISRESIDGLRKAGVNPVLFGEQIPHFGNELSQEDFSDGEARLHYLFGIAPHNNPSPITRICAMAKTIHQIIQTTQTQLWG